MKKTMKVRSAKQVGSRLQQLRDTCEDSRSTFGFLLSIRLVLSISPIVRALISSKDWSDHEDVDTTQPQITTCSSPRGQSNQEQESAYPPSPIYPSSGDLQQYQSEDFSADTSPQETAPAASCVFVNGWSESQAPSAPIHSIPSREHNYVKSEGMFQPGMNVAGPVMDGTMYGHQFEDIHGRAEDMQQLSLSESVAYGYGQGSFDNVQHASYTVPTLFIDTSLLPSYTWSEPRTDESTLCSSESSQVASPWGSSAGSPASQSTLSDSDFAAMQAYTQYSPPFYPQDHSSSWSGLEAPEDGLDEALYPGYQTSTWESITWQSPQKV